VHVTLHEMNANNENKFKKKNYKSTTHTRGPSWNMLFKENSNCVKDLTHKLKENLHCINVIVEKACNFSRLFPADKKSVEQSRDFF
jgi:hypothetical protein